MTKQKHNLPDLIFSQDSYQEAHVPPPTDPAVPISIPPPVLESVTITSGSTFQDFDMPATRPDGDLYVVILAGMSGDSFGGNFTLPGWNLAGGQTDDNFGLFYQESVFWRIGSSEPASYSALSTATAQDLESRAIVLRISGGAFDAVAFNPVRTENPSVAPDVTVAQNNSILLRGLVQTDALNGFITPSTPADHTEIVNTSQTGVVHVLYQQDAAQDAGAAGTLNIPNSAGPGTGYSIVISPA